MEETGQMGDAATATAFESPLLTTHEAADYLRVKVCTIRRMVKAGELPAVRVGHRDCIRKAALDLWIKAHEFRRISSPSTVQQAAK
jgi:excisionase family DNA binding protein